MGKPGLRQIRAWYNDDTIRVYQAYSDAIADSALNEGTFVSPPFSMSRMTWIKPSFLWMMYRAGWGLKDPGQKRILAISIKRSGFEVALKQAVLSHFELNSAGQSFDQWQSSLTNSSVRVQWDPERDLTLQPLDYRSIQIGLRGDAVKSYVTEWIASITEITDLASQVRELVTNKQYDKAKELLPEERLYPLTPEIALSIHASN